MEYFSASCNEFFRYTAYGQGIWSEIELPELREAPEAPPNITIYNRRPDPSILAKVDRGQYFPGVIGGVGSFFMREGRELYVSSYPGVNLARLRMSILGPLFSILLRQQGLNVLHAGCVEVDGKAVAFIGDCGSGKSTTTEAFYCCGYGILGDDVQAIDIREGRHVVLPGTPQVKLRPDAADAIFGQNNNLPWIFPEGVRRVHMATANFPLFPVPLHKIYVLQFDDEITEEPLRAPEALGHLLRHSRGIPPLQEPEFLRRQLSQCSHLLQEVPVCILKRPRSLEQLPALVEYVVDRLNHSEGVSGCYACRDVTQSYA